MASTLPRPPNARSPSEQPTHSPSEPSARSHCDTHNAQRPARVCSRHRRTAQLPPVQPARTPMAANPPVVAAPTIVRQGMALGVSVSIVSLMDRRTNVPTAWTFQREVEAALYGNGYANQTGAVYQLLRRSGVGSRSLSLKKASVAQGHVTQHEFEWLSTHLGDSVQTG